MLPECGVFEHGVQRRDSDLSSYTGAANFRAAAARARRGCRTASGSHGNRPDHGIPKAVGRRGPRSNEALGAKPAEIARAHPGARVRLRCESLPRTRSGDEARIGQKGRTCHRRYVRGVRPPGLADRRVAGLDPFAAGRPGNEQALALALPEATTTSMAVFPARFAGPHGTRYPRRPRPGSGRRDAARASSPVPENVTLLPLPAYGSELDPLERVRLYRRERFLPHRVLDDHTAVPAAARRAWNAPAAEPGRLESLTGYNLLRSELPCAGITRRCS